MLQLKHYGGYSSVAERRSVAADVVGSKPTSRPNDPPPQQQLRKRGGSDQGLLAGFPLQIGSVSAWRLRSCVEQDFGLRKGLEGPSLTPPKSVQSIQTKWLRFELRASHSSLWCSAGEIAGPVRGVIRRCLGWVSVKYWVFMSVAR
jgi:hypothetical protein